VQECIGRALCVHGALREIRADGILNAIRSRYIGFTID
jgi:hypothetical protein